MKGQTNRRIIKGHLPRALRNDATDTERVLWQHLRNRQMDGCKFRRQHPFDNFILDFVCLERHVIVELDGSQHADNDAHDAERTRILEASGFVVLRFWNNDVSGNIDGVLGLIHECVVRNRTPSPPNPPLEGEG